MDVKDLIRLRRNVSEALPSDIKVYGVGTSGGRMFFHVDRLPKEAVKVLNKSFGTWNASPRGSEAKGSEFRPAIRVEVVTDKSEVES